MLQWNKKTKKTKMSNHPRQIQVHQSLQRDPHLNSLIHQTQLLQMVKINHLKIRPTRKQMRVGLEVMMKSLRWLSLITWNLSKNRNKAAMEEL
jgi:hypothetical protein